MKLLPEMQFHVSGCLVERHRTSMYGRKNFTFCFYFLAKLLERVGLKKKVMLVIVDKISFKPDGRD